MNVLLATVADMPWSDRLRAEVTAVARLDRFGVHVLVDDAESADIILMLDAHQHLGDWAMRALRRDRYVRRFPQKVFVYDERDEPRDALPGVYVAMPRKRFDANRHCAGGYYRVKTDTRGVQNADPDLLFSFQGRRVATLRNAVLALRHPRGLVEDTSQLDFFAADQVSLDDAQARYRETLGRSKFVLCPRGAGTASFRLFEALACGRVPVVLSDGWVAPAGVDWESCSVRVAERDAALVPERLEKLEPAWPQMSAAARTVYEERFAPEVWLHTVVEDCLELRARGACGVARQLSSLEYWRVGGRHLKHALRRAIGR
jgi:glycosyltransferase involved in cell wall biosynthesis